MGSLIIFKILVINRAQLKYKYEKNSNFICSSSTYWFYVM